MEYEDLVGIPFKDGGRGKSGMDCWGLVKECYKRRGVDTEDYDVSALELTKVEDTMKHEASCKWKRLDAPREGCVVLLRLPGTKWGNHVGMYIGHGKFIHAYAPTGVVVDRIKRWQSRIVGYYEPR